METAFQVFRGEGLILILALCGVSVFVALVASALWIAGDAERRGMDAAMWVILFVVMSLLVPILGFVIVLVVYLVVRENHPIGGGFPVGYGPYPPYPPPEVPAACPVCDKPMTWYPQVSRWYCHSCGQYR